MAPPKQGNKQGKGKQLELGEEKHTNLASEQGEGGMFSSNSDELTQIRRAQEQLLVAISNMSAKCDLLFQSIIDGLGNREGIGTYQIWVPTDGVGGDDPTQGVNREHQQKEQLWSSSCRQHRDDHVHGINSNRQQLEQTWSSGGRQQQGLPSMEGPTMFPGGRLQQGIPRSGMEHVRPNAQEGFHQPAPNEDCSKLMDCCYKGILDNREGIGTSHIRVYAKGGNVNDQAATKTNSHLLFQQQQHHFQQQQQNLGQQQIGFQKI